MADISKEQWLPVVGFEKYYMISDRGRLKKLAYTDKKGVKHDDKILSVKNSKGWYLTSVLSTPECTKTGRIHRMVHEAFIGPIPPGHHVHHIDGNKQNNRAINLVLAKGNIHLSLHAHNSKTYKTMNQYNINRARRVAQYSLQGEFIAEYVSAKEASRKTGVCKRNIQQIVNKTEYKPGKLRKTAGGFIWKPVI